MAMAEHRHWRIVKPLQDAFSTQERRIRLTFKSLPPANAVSYLNAARDLNILGFRPEDWVYLMRSSAEGSWKPGRVFEVTLGPHCSWSFLGTLAGGLATYVESVEVIADSV